MMYTFILIWLAAISGAMIVQVIRARRAAYLRRMDERVHAMLERKPVLMPDEFVRRCRGG